MIAWIRSTMAVPFVSRAKVYAMAQAALIAMPDR
jgi:hypothetical protein